jgi:ketosteroid isomerase-like protein
MTEPTELADVVQRFYQAFAARDIDAIEHMSSDDPSAVAIGTDPDEWLEGGPQIKAALREQLADAQLTIKPGNPRIGQAGDIGWFADRPAFVTADGHEIPCRLTGVWRREDKEWKLLQSHTSIGVPNAQAFGP